MAALPACQLLIETNFGGEPLDSCEHPRGDNFYVNYMLNMRVMNVELSGLTSFSLLYQTQKNFSNFVKLHGLEKNKNKQLKKLESNQRTLVKHSKLKM